jgi:VIT1/CCC1 family predicted Fe2+/Mn2+ transporter
MDDDQVLVVVSAAQLATGAGGLALALRRRHAFDIAFWHGQPSAVGRDSLLMGTALSAPAVMLGAQAGAITALLRGPNPAARRVLGGLGAAMVAGYLAERLVRHRLAPSGWDAAESPVIVAGISLAAAMALLGLRGGGPPA